MKYVKEDNRMVLTIKDNTTFFGHLFVFLISFWSVGIGNLLYFTYSLDIDRKVK
jgi:hypothetical protein